MDLGDIFQPRIIIGGCIRESTLTASFLNLVLQTSANGVPESDIRGTILLTTLVIVLVAELSSAARSVPLNELIRIHPNPRFKPLYMGRLPYIHFVNLMLLNMGFLYTEHIELPGALGVANPIILIVLLALPFFEIEEYDSVRQIWLQSSFLIHLVILGATYALVSFAPSIWALLLVIPALGSVFFTSALHTDLRKEIHEDNDWRPETYLDLLRR